jgi:hypothetical protein
VGECNKVIFAKKISIFLKQVFTYVLLFSLVVRPLFIVGHIAYYRLNIAYITEKFCENKDKPQLQCNGKCHLAKELSLVNASSEEPTDEPIKISNAYKSFAPLFFQKTILKVSNEGAIDPRNTSLFFYDNHYTFFREFGLFRPPIV